MREVDVAQSRIEDVTVFARGARVRRVLSVAAPLPDSLRLTGLLISVVTLEYKVKSQRGVAGV
jgi:hypothetical protein